ncbi:hypothetical protein ACFOWX_09440 [Sphingorhabdus arenilitoris]|uniref:Transposase n=1 Tax=Sphingorhabdus arenilitoris TaxID=1490041 RepID=A0ABV8RGY3_9SPHN
MPQLPGIYHALIASFIAAEVQERNELEGNDAIDGYRLRRAVRGGKKGPRKAGDDQHIILWR